MGAGQADWKRWHDQDGPRALERLPGGHALDAAAGIAKAFGAHLSVLHVHLDERDLVLSAASSDPTGAAAGSGLIEGTIRDADEREVAAKQAFDVFCTCECLTVVDQPCAGGLLAMGGYGHSRLRELVFGGFTGRILQGVGLPVPTAH